MGWVIFLYPEYADIIDGLKDDKLMEVINSAEMYNKVIAIRLLFE